MVTVRGVYMNPQCLPTPSPSTPGSPPSASKHPQHAERDQRPLRPISAKNAVSCIHSAIFTARTTVPSQRRKLIPVRSVPRPTSPHSSHTHHHDQSTPTSIKFDYYKEPETRSSRGDQVHHTDHTKPLDPAEPPPAPTVPAHKPITILAIDQLPDELKHLNIASIDPTQWQNTCNAPKIEWRKGLPLDITTDLDGYSLLTAEELHTCATLRFLPAHYLFIKRTLLAAVQERWFRKVDVQGWFRMDVNKSAKVYDWYVALGWLPGSAAEWETIYKKQPLPRVPIRRRSANAVTAPNRRTNGAAIASC
ncbi:hypothetical protein SeMB42_g06928 [Synchytrium endobioticum]|uniref:SWIRM domain-containing protein n=1 Tax=Synchytrium endobioticum TaxID=286115 RepID=A0A507CDT6_9FUNG|nr:hypothetical protein SeMB42_g06928 [Synchytrium endobioticum]